MGSSTSKLPLQILKIVIVGDNFVGKTCIFNRIIYDEFKETSITVSWNMELKTFKMNGQELLVELWDTNSGYKRIEDCNDIEKFDGVIVVYDITNLNSFKRVPEWITQIKKFVPDDVLFLVLGSHQDLVCSRQVCSDDGLRTANDFAALFQEASAKTGEGINEAVHKFVRRILFCKNGIELAVEVDVKNEELGKQFLTTQTMNSEQESSTSQNTVTPVNCTHFNSSRSSKETKCFGEISPLIETKNSVKENESERNLKKFGRSESAQNISLPKKTELLQSSSESLTHSENKNTSELTKHSEEPESESQTVPESPTLQNELSKPKVTLSPYTFKVVFVGDSAVGKSCILQRILENNYKEAYRPTIVQYYEKEIDVEERKIKLKFWDTAGNVKLQHAILPYLCNTDAVLIVYSVIEEDSIKNVKNWIDNVKERNQDDTIIFIIGTKMDLRKSEEAFEIAGKQFTTEDIGFLFETSAKTGEGIKEIMNTLLRLLTCKINKRQELS